MLVLCDSFGVYTTMKVRFLNYSNKGGGHDNIQGFVFRIMNQAFKTEQILLYMYNCVMNFIL